MPKISVILAVCNGERFLTETLDSILAQTFQDFEVIVVDDGSTDQTPRILASYQGKDPRFIVERNIANLGIPKSRNLGCSLASAEYIAVSDADDISLPSRFERQLEFLESHSNIAAVGTAARFIDGNGNLGDKIEVPTPPSLIRWLLPFDNTFVHSSVMMRRNPLASVGYYSEDKPVALDYDLFARLSRTHGLSNIADVLVLYRISEGSISLTRAALQNEIADRVSADLLGTWLAKPVRQDLIPLFRHPQRLREGSLTSKIVREVSGLYAEFFRAYTTSVQLSIVDKKAITADFAMRMIRLARAAARQSLLIEAARLFTLGFFASPVAVVSKLVQSSRRAL